MKKKTKKPEDSNQTTGPSEAAEKSAASSTSLPEVTIPANGWPFNPTPKFSAAWWLENRAEGCLAHDESYQPNNINADSWIVKFCFGPEVACLLDFDCPTPYPTATDALLWLRIEVLPQLVDHPASRNVAMECIDRIDAAPAGTDAATLLNELKPKLIQTFPFIDISMICPIHEWLSTQGTQAEFRKCYGTDAISCVKGRWSMPQLWWDRLVYDLSNNEMEYLSVPNGHPSSPWPPPREFEGFVVLNDGETYSSISGCQLVIPSRNKDKFIAAMESGSNIAVLEDFKEGEDFIRVNLKEIVGGYLGRS